MGFFCLVLYAWGLVAAENYSPRCSFASVQVNAILFIIWLVAVGQLIEQVVNDFKFEGSNPGSPLALEENNGKIKDT
jgi:hypothetical protein